MPGSHPTRRETLRWSTTVGIGGIAGCLGGSQGEGNVGITLASTFEPGHVNVVAAEEFKERIEAETGDRFSVDIVAGGAYGSEDEISEIVSHRGVEAHAAGTVPYLQYASEYWFFGSPLVIDDYEHLQRVMESDLMDGVVEQMIENGNQRPIGGQIRRGVRHTTANEPIRTPEDAQGLDIRLPELYPWVSIWEEIGVNPTPVALDELYSALQMGTVDASEGDAEQIDSVNLNEVQSHLSLTGHLPEIGGLYINDEFFRELDETYRDLVLELGQEATDAASEGAREEEQNLLDTLSEEGMTIVEDVDQEAFQNAGRDAVEQLFETEWVGTWEEVRSV